MLFIVGYFILPLISSWHVIVPKLISAENFNSSFILNLLLLPNFASEFNPICFQSWSIGVEEQFYIFWPLLVNRIFSVKKLTVVMVLLVVCIYLIRSLVIINQFSDFEFFNRLNLFFGASRFDNMAIGGLLAIYYKKSNEFKFNFISKIILLVSLLIILLSIFSIGFGLDNIIASIVFAFLILYVIGLDNQIFLENNTLKYLGKVSYGIYMYHVLGIYLAINILLKINKNFNGFGVLNNLFLYFFSVAFTIIISQISYRYYESYFLKFKK
ncbi:Acyltransferase family protein [Flavobacterium xanthum]|uniref:Acyltransferase family protein n=1 Tax=Flavobacterium xanthum TaxID=69322 RepID=A0A1M6YBP9_9FLAO|nr:Acyltransferase family protein [Flavobacterium xanthum]